MDKQEEISGCTLSTLELVDRRAAWGDVALALIDRVRTAGGLRVRFQHDPRVRTLLHALVEAEGKCCGWASWELADDGHHVVLEVTGPPQEIAGLARDFGL